MARITQAVVTMVCQVRFPEVMNEAAPEVGQDIEMIHGLGTAFFVNAIKSQ